MKVARRLYSMGLLATVLLGCGMSACFTRPGDTFTITPAVPRVTVACPPLGTGGHPDWPLTDSVLTTLRANGICNYMIPEYHDEQRLADGAGDLGPIAYVFASPIVGTHLRHDAYDTEYVNVGIVDVREADPAKIPATYGALRLGPDVSCLYIRHKHSWLRTRWVAAIGRPQGPERLCAGPSVTEQLVTAVNVTRENAGLDAARYASVARFIEIGENAT
ncbi:MAG TPA: hypothetical protein VFO55_09965, partial [Gemmatimonadaceae bacterium]|nr:hypothetical protein [Gemmatimonadaceae bacterium]